MLYCYSIENDVKLYFKLYLQFWSVFTSQKIFYHCISNYQFFTELRIKIMFFFLYLRIFPVYCLGHFALTNLAIKQSEILKHLQHDEY